MPKSGKSYWIPLESNPSLLTKFAHAAGVSDQWQFHDVWGMDDELLAFVPQPCKAVLLLFPYTKIKTSKKDEIAQLEKDGNEVSTEVYFMHQTVGNACGTVAVMHALANNAKELGVADGFLKDFMTTTESTDPEARGRALEECDSIAQVHEEVAHDGQTDAPEAESSVDFHFICFVCKENAIYELDGGKPCAINHGATTPETFLKDTVKVVKSKFMAHDPENPNFSLITLGPSAEQS